jgi:uncharacterized protein
MASKRFEMGETQTELGMGIIWDAPIEMDDGTMLRADVLLPEQNGNYPVLMTYGRTQKASHFKTVIKAAGTEW